MNTLNNTFKDISNFNNTNDYLPLFNGALITELIMLFLFNHKIFTSKTLKEWYTKYNLSAIIADVFILVIGFIIVRLIYSSIFSTFSILKFILLLVIVQTIHDILFYFMVINIKRGTNKMIDTFKDYIKEHNASILIADSLLIISGGLFSSYVANYSTTTNIALLILLIYLIPFFLYH
jgi:uncharacterized protein YacL